MRFVDIECEAVTEVIGRRAFNTREDIQEFLDNIPTADVKEVVRSMWRIYKDGSAVCKHCNRTTMYAWDHESWMRYCPNCGSLMVDIEVKQYENY